MTRPAITDAQVDAARRAHEHSLWSAHANCSGSVDFNACMRAALEAAQLAAPDAAAIRRAALEEAAVECDRLRREYYSPEDKERFGCVLCAKTIRALIDNPGASR